MKTIQRFAAVAGAIIGGAMGIIIMALFNSLFNIDLSFGQVFIIGLLTGTVFGVFSGLVVTYYLLNKARKFIIQKISTFFSKFHFPKSV